MKKVIKAENCGNAPKQKYVLDFLVAVAKTDRETALNMLADTAEIEIIGKAKVVGKEEIRNLLTEDGSRAAVDTMEIFNIISHGNVCAANGVWRFADGGNVAFNTMYTFDGFGKKARINKVQTYSINLS